MDRQEFAVHDQKSLEYDDIEKRISELFDLPGFIARISPSDKIAYRKMRLSSQHKDLLPRDSLQESVPSQKEQWQNKYQNDDEKKSRRSSEHNSQETEEQIADDSVKLNASSSVETASSGIRTDANNCQTKIQERSLSAKKSSDNAIQNSVQETKEKNSHTDSNIILTNDKNISVQKSSTKIKLDSFMSKNKLLRKSAHNSVRESKNKSLHFKSKTISSKNRCINKEHSSRNKFKTSAPIRLKKHHSKSSIEKSSKNSTISEKECEQDKKEQKREIEINQESSSSKIKSLDSRVQEHSNESKNSDNSCEHNVYDTTILNSRTCLETETNGIVDENQNTPISNTQTSRIDSDSKVFVKIDAQDENMRTKFTDLQRDSLFVEPDSKRAVKKSTHSESSDESISTKKMQKKKEASLDGSLDENLMSDTEIFDRKMLSEDKRIHDNNEKEKQIFWKRITEYMIKKREYRYHRERRKIQRKRQNKIKRIRQKFRDCFQECPSKSESDEDCKIISECLEKRNLQFVSNNSEIYDTSNDITTEEEMELVNDLQQDSESVASQVESIDSNASTICIQNDTLHDLTTDEETDEKTTDFNRNKTSTCKRHMSVDTSQENIENIENVIPVKIQRTENSVLIADAETVVSKNDTGCSEDAINVESKEVNMQDAQEDQKNIENADYAETKEVNIENTQENQENVENINLANDVKISKDIRPNLILSAISAQELITNIEEKDGCDVSQIVEKVLLTNNEDTMKNKTTVITDHASIMSPELEESSSNKKDVINEALSSSTASSKKSDINTSDDNSSIDDDNISDIEVEIKIKPKSKSRISKKFSLKAPLSVVNTCICKNLNALKSKPDILGKLFQMSFKTSSENSRHGNTISSEENEAKNTSEKSSDVNQDITAETASHIREVICNSSHITKDNTNHSSKQQQDPDSQNDTIFDRDATHHQEEKNKHVQSAEQEKMQVISENGSESAKSTFDLEKQLPKPSSNDKEKIADEQQKNPQDNIVSIEDEDTTKGDQEKKNERVQTLEGKGTSPENSVELTKSALDMPDLEKQLPKTSSKTLDAKGIVRVRTSAELGSSWNSIPINLSMNSGVSITSDNIHSVSSASACRPSPPLYSSATKSACHSPKSNLFGVSANNFSSNFDDITKLTQDAILNVCLNFASCRKIYVERITEEEMNKMKINLIQISQNIDTLKILLHTPNEDSIINYINQQKMLTLPISIIEYKQYWILYQNYVSFVACSPPFHDKMYSSMPQHSNINSSVPNASAPNVHAQSPYLGNVSGMPLPGMQHLRAQSSTMPPPRPSINRSQSSRSANNSSRLRQPVPILPNIRPSNPISNPTINPQQPVGNASYLQGQRMPNVSSVNNQQFFVVNSSNTLHTSSSAASASNINMRMYSANQGNTNVSSTTGQKHSHVGSATAAFAINMQQQNQTSYSHQMPFYVNSGGSYFSVLMTNQNINGMNPFVHNVTQSKVCTIVNAPGNVTGNVGLGNPFVNPQTPSVPAEKNVPQYNNSVPNSVASQSARIQNILPNPSQQQQNSQQYLHQRLPNGTSISLINLTNNNVSQSTQPSVPNKKTRISETQIRDRMPNQTPFAKPQQNVRQGTPCVHNVCVNAYECVHKESQKSSGIFTKNPVSQEPSVSQNSSNTTSQKDKMRLLKPTPMQSPSNEIVNPHFNLSILTDLQKFILIDQLKFYLERCSPKQQDSQKLRLERKMLVLYYESLHNYISKMMRENQIKEKLQNDASRKISKILLNHLSKIETSCNKIQSNKTNENNSICDKVGEKQSLKKNIDLNTSVNSKSTMEESDLLMKAQNRDSLLQSKLKSTIINNEESSPGTVDLRKRTTDTPKMRCKRNLSSVMEKQSENIKTSLDSGHANILEENSIAETSRRISETKTQDDANINKIAKSPAEKSHVERLPTLCSLLAQNTSSFLRNALSDEIKGCSKIAKDDAKKTDNIETGNILKISNVITLNNIKENNAISQSSFNTKTQDNIINKETEKSSARDLHDKRLSESCSSPIQKTLNLQDNETKDDNVNIGGPDNAEADNICKISNITVLNSNEGNEKAVSQVPCNTVEARDKELYHNEACNLNNKISGENSHDGMRDNEKTRENTKRSIFTETQSNTSCIPRTSTPLISDNTSELLFPTNRSESAETSQVHTAHEKYTFETLSEFLSTLSQDDPTNEQINNSERMYDESYDESSGNLHIDENVEKSSSDLQEEQHDKVSSSGNDKPNMSQGLCLDKTRCESIDITSLPPFVEDFELRLLAIKEQNVQKLNEKLSSKQKEIQAEEVSSSEIPKDTSSMRAAMESIDTAKELENMKENQVQMDTHSGVKAINELLRHVSDRYNGKSRTSSCNPTMKSNAANVNVNETVVDKNDISNSKIVASPTKSEDDHENSDIIMNILNVTSISSSLFEKIDNSDALFSDDLALLDETKEKSSYANDNLEVSNSTSLNEIKVEESLNVNDKPEIPDSVLLKKIKIEKSLNIDDNLEVPDSLNEMKEEKLSDMNDNPDVFNSISLNETYTEKSFNYNPDIYNFEWLNEMKEEKSLNNDPEILNSASSNEIKEGKSSDVDDNLEINNFAWLNEMKEEKSLNMNNDPEVLPNSASLNERKEGKSSDMDDNLEAHNFVWLNELKEEKSLNMNNDPEVLPNSASLNERKEGKSSDMDDNLEAHNFVWLNELKEEKSLNMNNDPEGLNSTSLNDMKEKENVNNNPEVVNSALSNEIKEEMSSAVNDNLEVPDEQENRPCLRCKRKSMVYCQACLEAPYCSKRCSDLHWKAIHYKHCKNLYKPIICIDL